MASGNTWPASQPDNTWLGLSISCSFTESPGSLGCHVAVSCSPLFIPSCYLPDFHPNAPCSALLVLEHSSVSNFFVSYCLCFRWSTIWQPPTQGPPIPFHLSPVVLCFTPSWHKSLKIAILWPLPKLVGHKKVTTTVLHTIVWKFIERGPATHSRSSINTYWINKGHKS